MARADLLSILYTKKMSPLEFHFESLRPPVGLYDILSPYDIRYMNSIATNPKLASKISKKTKLLNEVMESRNFKKLVQGTNRICYKHYTYPQIVCKVAVDRVGLSDTPAEYNNQMILKPFVTKVFEMSEFGQVGMFERVDPVTSIQQFLSIAPDAFDLIYKFLSNNKYALEDIGSNCFLNYGIRKGFGPVLLDFPYMVEIDPAKLVCHNKDPLSPTGYCLGEIDYDSGFNKFICTKCGKQYFAKEIAKEPEKPEKQKVIKKSGGLHMKITLKRGENVVMERELGKNMKQTNFIPNKSRIKLTYENGQPKAEPVEEKVEEVVNTSTEEKVQEKIISVKPEYKDSSERNNKKQKRQPSNNDRYYFDENGNYRRRKGKFNNNTSVADVPIIENSIYKNRDMAVPSPVSTNKEATSHMNNIPDIPEQEEENTVETVVEEQEQTDNTVQIVSKEMNTEEDPY